MESKIKDRYSRQILLIGEKNQKKLAKAKIGIVGLGALGSAAAELLARTGIGTLYLWDADRIEESNLSRQHLYTEEDLGQFKVKAAEKRIKKINSKIIIKSFIKY